MGVVLDTPVDFSEAAPGDLGLPPRFREFRDAQVRAMSLIQNCKKRHLILPMPTGSGKSLAVMGAAAALPGRTLILTGTRALQDQYQRDFASVAVDLRGKANYPCNLPGMSASDTAKYGKDGVVTCDFAPCSDGWKCPQRRHVDKDGMEHKEKCHYFKQVERARAAKIVVTNYACWLAIHNYAQGLGGFERIVLDEAHNAGDYICRFLTFQLSLHRWGFHHLSEVPKGTSGREWLIWAVNTLPKLKERVKSAQKGRIRRELLELEQALGQYVEHGREDWVVTTWKNTVSVQPVWPFDYLALLTGEIPRVVLVSATLTRKTVQLLGVGHGAFDFRDFSTTFPAERRPFYFFPVCPANSNTSEEGRLERLQKIAAVADRIIEARPGRRGIIHSVSYTRARELFQASGQKDRLIVHQQGTGGLQRAVEEYLAREDGVLVTPAAAEGVDLPHDGCRFQILVKVPFPDRRDPVTKARTDHDKDYVAHLVGEQITQIYGRAMRTVDDWGETFILDADWGWFGPKCRDYMPDHVWEALERVPGLQGAMGEPR